MSRRSTQILRSVPLCLLLLFGRIAATAADTLPPHQLLQLLSADSVNQELVDQGRATPQTLPFQGGSRVTELRTTADGYYIRFFSFDPSRFHNGAVGSWMMLTADVLGRPLGAITDLYALPRMPDHFVIIKVPAGTRMRSGTAGPIFGWGRGGGQQILLLDRLATEDYQTTAALPETVRSGSLAAQASGINAFNTAAYLDGLPDGDPFSYLQVVRLSLSYLEGEAFDAALNRIGPERYDALNRTGLEQGLLFNHVLRDPARMGMARQSQETTVLWGGGIGRYSVTAADGEHTGFDIVSGGIMTGMQYRPNPHVAFGCGVGLLQSTVDFPQNGGDGKSRSLNLGCNGSFLSGPFALTVLMSGAVLSDQLDRTLRFSGVDRTAHGELDGYRLTAGIEAAWTVEFADNLAITPYIGTSLVHLFHQGLTEMNAEDLNLQVRDFEAQTLIPEIGARMEFKTDTLPFRFSAGLGYAASIPLDDRKIVAGLQDQTGSFSAVGRDETLHVLVPSLNLVTGSADACELRLGYTGELAAGLRAHTFTAILSLLF